VTEALFLERLAELRADLERRIDLNSWPAEGLTNGMCRFCEYAKCCRGEMRFDELKPRLLRDVDKEIDRRRKRESK
jgi:hypothetical protein